MAPTLTRRQTLAAALALAAFPTRLPAQPGGAPNVGEMVLGSDDAPLTVIEYAMFTCPHCANFQREVIPKFKAEYIDTGKARLVFREFYGDVVGLWAGMIARCTAPSRYFAVVDEIFATQDEWLIKPADNAARLEKLYAIGKQAGLTPEQMDACLVYCRDEKYMDRCGTDNPLAKGLVDQFRKTAGADEVTGTPTFLIGGKKVVGEMSWPEFKSEVDAALAG